VKATETTLQELLGGQKQYQVPLYQRTYSWGSPQLSQLWDDIVALAGDYAAGRAGSHFIGSLVLAPSPSLQPTLQEWLVVDGQQRLTTLSLLLCALRDHLAVDAPEQRERIDELFLVNKWRPGAERHKLLPTQADRDAYVAVLDGQVDAGKGEGVGAAYRWFRSALVTASREEDPVELALLEPRVSQRRQRPCGEPATPRRPRTRRPAAGARMSNARPARRSPEPRKDPERPEQPAGGRRDPYADFTRPAWVTAEMAAKAKQNPHYAARLREPKEGDDLRWGAPAEEMMYADDFKRFPLAYPHPTLVRSLRVDCEMVTDAIATVEETGLIDLLADAGFSFDHPRDINLMALFVSMDLCGSLGLPWTRAAMHRLLRIHMSPCCQERLGIRPLDVALTDIATLEQQNSYHNAYHRFYNSFQALASFCNPDICMPGHRLPKWLLGEMRSEQEHDPAAKSRKAVAQRVLRHILDRLINASLDTAEPELREELLDANLALDESGIDTYAAERADKSSRTSTDPASTWYYKRPKDLVHGITAAVASHTQAGKSLPSVVVGASVHPSHGSDPNAAGEIAEGIRHKLIKPVVQVAS